MNIALKRQQEKRRRFEAEKANKKSNELESLRAAEPQGAIDEHRTLIVESALEKDLALLSDIKDIKKKAELKQSLIPKYQNYLQAYRDDGEVKRPNLVLVYFVIWLIDARKIEEAIDWAKFAIEQHQQLPPHFKRDLPTLVTEEITEWAIDVSKNGQAYQPYIEQLCELVDGKQWDVSEPVVLSKLFKLQAMHCDAQKEFREAVAWYGKCVDANPEKHGVKTKLESAMKNAGL